MKKNILITGAAGFIGYSLCKKILELKKYNIIGIDNYDSYYSVDLKKKRILNIKNHHSNKCFKFYKCDISNFNKLKSIFKKNKIFIVINLAAQAGVRYSLVNSKKYLNSNIIGFYNLIELVKINKINNFYYASTSSVYGSNNKLPFDEKKSTDSPLNFYAATKKCNEVIAHSYSHLYNINTVGLRFFTVYGPWGRPDMALFKFTNRIRDKKNIEVFNYGNHFRDFTYVDDIVVSIIKLVDRNIALSKKGKLSSYQIFNIGNEKKEPLKKYISLIEKYLKIKAKKKFLPMQDGDMKATYSNSSKLHRYINFKPKTKIEIGIKKFIEWYKFFYK